MSKFCRDNLAVFICSHVFENTKPTLLVCHEGGDWQFLCGGAHDVDDKPKVVGIGHLLERDPTLHEISNLPIDFEAERKEVGGEWIVSMLEE